MTRHAHAMMALLLATAFMACCSDNPQKHRVNASYDVVITSFVERHKIRAIKSVRTVTGLGLSESRDLVELAPSLVKKGVSKEEADRIAATLSGAYMTVEVRRRR